MVSGEFQRRVREIRGHKWQSKFSFLPTAVKEGDEQVFLKIVEEAKRDFIKLPRGEFGKKWFGVE